MGTANWELGIGEMTNDKQQTTNKKQPTTNKK